MFGTGLGRKTGLSWVVNGLARLFGALRYRLILTRNRLARKAGRPDLARPAITWPDDTTADRAKFAALTSQPGPELTYVLYFTPRSGSSRLSDLIGQTGRLGAPGECYHPLNAPVMAKVLGATSLDEFIEVVSRFKTRGGVFGADVTYTMLDRTFGSEERFLQTYGAAPCFWLIREDIVLQALSLQKMNLTNIAHAPSSSEADRAKAEAGFEYDAAEITRWIGHIRRMEIATEKMFALNGLTPKRLSYERLTRMAEADIVRMVGDHIGVADIGDTQFETRHVKIGTARNDTFAERFKAENAPVMAQLLQERQPMIDALDGQ